MIDRFVRQLRSGALKKPAYDESYLDQLIVKATPAWREIPDVDEWLRDLRGYED